MIVKMVYGKQTVLKPAKTNFIINRSRRKLIPNDGIIQWFPTLFGQRPLLFRWRASGATKKFFNLADPIYMKE